MTTLKQRGEVLGDAFQEAGFQTEGSTGPRFYTLFVNRPPTDEERAQHVVFSRVATMRIYKDGTIDVQHGLNAITPVLKRVGLMQFVGPKLITTENSPKAERAVRSAAAARFGRVRKDVFYEHGQWWVRMQGDDPYEDRTYSAVDIGRGGVGFEQV
jgi:hypothetical protein